MTRSEAAKLARAAKAAKEGPLADRFWSKVDRSVPGCWEWTAAVRRKEEGYGAFWMGGRHQPAHRVAWELTHSAKVPAGMVVCHACDNPKCCNPAHLFIGSALENNDDKVQKRRHAYGEKSGTAKLTEADVRRIKAAKPSGRAGYGHRAALAARYGVSPSTINDVWSRRWTHVR